MKRWILFGVIAGLTAALVVVVAEMLLWSGLWIRTVAPTGWQTTAVDEDDPAAPLVRAVQQWTTGPPAGPHLEQFRNQWPPQRIHPFLDHELPVVRGSAVLALRLVGDRGSIDPLISRLVDPSGRIRHQADLAVWQIWFRLGSDHANQMVALAAKFIRVGATTEALEVLALAIADSPDFAEAYNQRAIVHFKMGDFAESAEDCYRTLERMPKHYGALSGLGQCLIELGRDAEALEVYREAHRINPNLKLPATIDELETKLRGGRQPV